MHGILGILGTCDAYVQERVASGMPSYAERNRPGAAELERQVPELKVCGVAGSGAESPHPALLRNDNLCADCGSSPRQSRAEASPRALQRN